MKLSAIVLSIVLLLVIKSEVGAAVRNYVNASSSSGPGGDSSVNVKINNDVNTQKNTYESPQGKTTTNVEINQSGEGTSEVTINGKTWKQEGPGSISVQENSDNSAATPTTGGSPTPSTGSASPTPTVLSDTDENVSGLGKMLNDFFASLRQFFSNLFN